MHKYTSELRADELGICYVHPIVGPKDTFSMLLCLMHRISSVEHSFSKDFWVTKSARQQQPLVEVFYKMAFRL
jgi:hypothetical protein